MPTILITGTSSGIGKATAKLFQKKGWKVIATMRSPEKETELNHLENIEVVQLDVTNKEQIKAVIAQCLKNYGLIDAVVNNAGYGLVGPFETATPEEIEKQFATNVFGLIKVSQALLPHFRERKQGTIVNVSSMGGRITFPFYSLYHASKWAVEGLTESLQYELAAFNIRVKLIEPGVIKTDFYDRSRIASKTTTAYSDLYNDVSKNMTTRHGIDPEIVAKTIYRAVTDHSTRLRYPVGTDAKLLLILRSIVPARLWTWIITKALMRSELRGQR